MENHPPKVIFNVLMSIFRLNSIRNKQKVLRFLRKFRKTLLFENQQLCVILTNDKRKQGRPVKKSVDKVEI